VVANAAEAEEDGDDLFHDFIPLGLAL